MRWLLFLLTLGAGAVRADNTVPGAPASSVAASCRWDATSYGRAVQSDPVRKAQKKIPPDFYFMQAGRNHFLFGDRWPGNKPRTIVWDAANERVVFDYAAAPAALVEAADGTFAGVLLMEKKGLKYVHARGDDRQEVGVKLDDNFADSASVAFDPDGCTAYIGLYHRISTGSALVSANLCTGALRWTADVIQLNVSHSKYFNEVTVERRGAEVILHGVEAGGCYEQTFVAATGARKSATFSKYQTR